MKRGILRFLAFAGAVAVLAGGLKILSWIPAVAQKDVLREYADVEEARATTSIGKIFVPSYFPQNLAWPPSRILAQGKPFPALIMEFEKVGGKEVALLISQSASEDFSSAGKVRMLEVTESVPYPLKGRDALLEVGVCERDEPCAGISWGEGTYRIVVRARTTPFELIKIAESMLK